MTRTDYLLDSKIKLTQNADGYRAGLDAVFLAAACPVESGQKLLDLGCGAGAASLCVAARVADVHVTGIEIQSEQAKLAQENFIQNNFAAEIIQADIREYALPSDHFDHVILNPPYHDHGRHDAPQNEQRAASFMMHDLAAWMDAARRVVKTHGSITIIHRADALADILAQLHGFGAIEIIPLWPRAGQAADRMIIRARKGRKTPLGLQPGIVLHESDGSSTETARTILRGGVKIP